MSTTTTTEAIPESARRLATDHEAFERTLFNLLGRVRSGDWHELDEVWDKLVDDVEDHFEFEETSVFPAFAERNEDCRALVNRLRDEHGQVRRSLGELGIQIQLHEVPAAAIKALVELLREHADLENLRIYPWAEAAAACRLPV